MFKAVHGFFKLDWIWLQGCLSLNLVKLETSRPSSTNISEFVSSASRSSESN